MMQDNKPIRVLHYIKHLESGGGETFLYNIYKNIDRDKVQFDFLVNESNEEKLDKKIEALGGKKIVLIKKEPKFIPLKILMAGKALKELLKKEDYGILHIHCSNGQGLLYANIARKAGVPVRITHIHNTTVEGKFVLLKRLFHFACKRLYMNAPTDYIACSKMAAEWLYSDNIVKNGKYILLKNGIESEKYAFSSEIRKKQRSILGWNDKKIILHIGRMEEQKNQIFLLNIFSEVCKLSCEYRLIMIGQGSLESIIKKRAEELCILEHILFIKYTTEVGKYLFASDVFLLPSLSEGLGIVAIEAQASGLPTIVSDRIPQEAFISDIITSVPLTEDAKTWAKKIIDMEVPKERVLGLNAVRNAGYDIRESASFLEQFYVEKSKNINEALENRS